MTEITESLHKVYLEYIELRKTKLLNEYKTKTIQTTQDLNSINKKIENLSTLVRCMKDELINIHKISPATISKIQEKSIKNPTSNYIQLSHEQHGAFMSLLETEQKIQELINIHQLDRIDHRDNFEEIVNETQKNNSILYKEYVGSSNAFTSTKEFIDNVSKIKNLDEELNHVSGDAVSPDSDLGCVPHDSYSFNFDAAALSEFASTSSPK